MASDPRNFGLGELGQRVQALGDPAAEPRLRPYQGASAPPPPVEQPAPVPSTHLPPGAPHAGYGSWPSTFTAAPAPPEPYTEPAAPHTSSGNGYANPGGQAYGQAATAQPPASHSAPPAAAAPEDPNAPKSGLQRALNAVRATLPLVQRLLPLLEGNIATAITTLVATQATQRPAAPPPPAQIHVDLEPVERGLAEVRTSNRELKTQFAEQATSLKRVEDQLDRVREATDRNTLEQQELVEDLRAVTGRISTFALIGLGLLVLSLLVNGYLLYQLQHILH